MESHAGTVTRRQALGGLSLAAATLACPGWAAPSAAPADATALLDAIAWRLLALQPERATSLGVDTDTHAGLRSRLEDRSPAGRALLTETLRADLARIEALDAALLDPATRTSVAVVRSAYRTALDGLALPYGDAQVGSWRNAPYVVIQNVGAYIDAPRFLDSDHPVRDAADADAYLARLEALAGQLDGELERVRAAAALGLIPPGFLLDKAILQLDRTIADARGGGPLVESLVRRSAAIPGDWRRRASAIVAAGIVPALARQAAELRAQRPRAPSDAGMWAQPHGPEWYAWALRAATTTALSPDQVHRQGLEELAAIHARMDPILRAQSYADGPVGARMAALAQDPRFKFAADDRGRAEIVRLMEDTLARVRPLLPRAFRTLARGNLEIRRLPPAEEGGGPVAYGGPGSIDGAIPGKVWLNLGNVDRLRRYTAPSLVLHEGIPGHVWQGEYAQKLPLIRSVLAFNAYSEGWAMYAETLGDELGLYDDDPVARLGYLQYQAWRAIRMVVDTGLHARRWSREQGIDWFAAQSGMQRAEVTAEVERYCSWPGQACGYKLGHSEILRQRERARIALGAAYDLRDFDQAVVDGGNVPLDVLAENVGRYIAETKSG